MKRTLDASNQRPISNCTCAPGQIVWSLNTQCKHLSNAVYLRCRVLNFTDASNENVHLEWVDNPSIFFQCPANHLHDCDDHFGLNDNAELTSLNYPNVVENIRTRFITASADPQKLHLIYTYAGWILFALNPYVGSAPIYDDSWCERYYNKSIAQIDPHPFAIASSAFSRLINDGQSQYILISGESGSGKTECSKHILKYLTWVTRKQRRAKGRVSVGGPGDAAETLARLLVASNPILEFFGNAKTSRNDNSSRFGKLFQIFYDSRGEHLLTAHLNTYLLAKSRVVKVPKGEENYHIFHSLLAAHKEEALDKLNLGQIPPDFVLSPFLGERPAYPTKDYQSNADFHLSVLLKALKDFDISATATTCLFRILLAILMLGLVTFDTRKDGLEGSQVKSKLVLRHVSNLLSIKGGAHRLEEVLTSQQIRDTRRRLDVDQATQLTHSLAKGLYESVFHFVVHLVRQRLQEEELKFCELELLENQRCVGVVDLFGFENMEPESWNGFEQLCINYANEQLHYHFMRQVVQREREIYGNEGIRVHGDFLSDIDQLFESEALSVLLGNRTSPGIFAILEEASTLGGPDRDETFCRRANQLIAVNSASRTKAISSSPHRRKRVALGKESTRISSHRFVIDHFAEPVIYTAQDFAARNQDHMSDELRSFLVSSTGEHVHAVVAYGVSPDESMSTKKTSMKSLSAVFVKQMALLISNLEQTSCFFVKCLKPNDTQEPFVFNHVRVLRQLVTGGVGPVLDIMKCGYPCRLTYAKLWDRYRYFIPATFPVKMECRDFAELSLKFLGIPSDSYRMGASKVFFQLGVLHKIEKLMEETSDELSAGVVEKMLGYWYRNRVTSIFCVSVALAKLARLLKRIRFRKIAVMAATAYVQEYLPRRRLKAGRMIVRFFQQRYQRFLFLKIKRSVIHIQRAYRKQREYKAAILQRHKDDELSSRKRLAAILTAVFLKRQKILQRQDVAAARIQAAYRGYKARQEVKEKSQKLMNWSATTLQRWWRRRRALCRRPATSMTPSRVHQPEQRTLAHTPISTFRKKKAVPPSCLLDHQRRGSVAFQYTRDFWEVATLSVGQAPEVKQEINRRRRSLFSTHIKSPFLIHTNSKGGINFSRQNSVVESSPRFGSDLSDGPLLQLQNQQVETGLPIEIEKEGTQQFGVRAGSEASKSVLSAQENICSHPTPLKPINFPRSPPSRHHPRSRRCIESGKTYGGLDSAQVVEIFVQALDSHREQNTRLGVTNLLEGVQMGTCLAKNPTVGDRNPEPAYEGNTPVLFTSGDVSCHTKLPGRSCQAPAATIADPLRDITQETEAGPLDLSETESFPPLFQSQIPVEPLAAHTLEPVFNASEGCGRLSIRAWQLNENSPYRLEESPVKHSFSDITAEGVENFLKSTKRGSSKKVNDCSILKEEAILNQFLEPQFSLPETRDSDLSDLLPQTFPNKTSVIHKDLTPRPKVLARSDLDVTRATLHPSKHLIVSSASKGIGTERSRIPLKPIKQKGKEEIRVMVVGSKRARQ